MNRRKFLCSSAAALVTGSVLSRTGAAPATPRPANFSKTKIAAYYFRAQMYTCVPRQIRDDMEWMAGCGTDYVCVAVLEQDLFAARENIDLVTEEAARVGMQVLGVPSRWGGLIAGAPKVPSLFSVLHPETWVVNSEGSTRVNPETSGVISSVHHPETLEFFQRTLAEMYRQHPAMAGMILDEPKCFMIDRSKMAEEALGANASLAANNAAARDFLSRICAYAKERWPGKFTIMFQQANHREAELAISSGVQHLDYYGGDGRPWTMEVDDGMKSSDSVQESGTGKVLLSGKGEALIQKARAIPGRKSFLLAENHNLHASMIDPMDRYYDEVLALKPDLFAYYYYPRNVAEPDRAMEVIRSHLLCHIRQA